MNQPGPIVSIVTVCLNASDVIDATVQSVLAQTYSQIEYIVVDGASTDGTLKRLQSYDAYIATLISEPDNGLYNAMNKALELITGDWVIFMNAGDTFVDDAVISRVMSAMAEHQEAMIAYGDYIARYENREVHIKQPEHLDKWRLWLKAVCHQTIFARKEVFEQVGKYDESLSITADWDWLLRGVLRHKLSSLHVPIEVCVFQMGGFCANRVVMERNKRVMRQHYYAFWERIAFVLREILLKVKVRLESGNFSPPWMIRQSVASSRERK